MYEYLCAKKDDAEDTWSTPEIQRFVRSWNPFAEMSSEEFLCRTPFIHLLTLRVKDTNNQSGNAFELQETNYVSTVLSERIVLSSQTKEFLGNLEQFSGARVRPD